MTVVQASDDRADLYADALTEITELVLQAQDSPRASRGTFLDQIAVVIDRLGAQLIKESIGSAAA